MDLRGGGGQGLGFGVSGFRGGGTVPAEQGRYNKEYPFWFSRTYESMHKEVVYQLEVRVHHDADYS